MTQQPQAKYRHDYRAPDYQITDIDLTFDLDAENRGHRNKPLFVMARLMRLFALMGKI